MPRDSDRESIAINGQVNNVLTGSLLQQAPANGIYTFAAVGPAAEIRATIIVGTDIVANDVRLSQAARFPELDKDVLAQWGAFRGDPVIFQLRQVAGAGAANVDWLVEFEPL